MRNTCYTWLRQNRAHELTEEFNEKLHDVARADGNPETLLLYDAQQQLLRQALEALPVAFREVIILRDLEGLPYCTHRGKAMKALVLTLIVCVTCAILMASAQSPQPATLTPTKGVTPLPVAVDGLQVRVEGAFVLVTLAYHNSTATALSIGLQQWANATTRLVDDVHNSYTLLQTFGIGYGYDRRYWLGLDAHGHATAAFLFRAEDPSSKQATRYTLTSGQQVIIDDTATEGIFTITLRNLTPG